MNEPNRPFDDDEVGYKKPPKQYQYPKGTSGNPKGRPKKDWGFHVGVLREAQSSILINEGGQHKRIPKIQGIVKQMANKALTGGPQHVRLFLDLYHQASESYLAANPQLDPRKKQAVDFTDEDLIAIILDAQKERR